MSRSGYSEDYDCNLLALYRGNVINAIRGKRGQAFLRDLIEALDAMPIKALITDDLIHKGGVCAIGALGVKRGVDMSNFDPEDAAGIGKTFNIAEQLAREVVFENDETGPRKETPEQRWQRMRNWAKANIRPAAES